MDGWIRLVVVSMSYRQIKGGSNKHSEVGVYVWRKNKKSRKKIKKNKKNKK
jgi:hypothetical protein